MSASLLTQFSARYYPASLPNTRRFRKALALLALAFPGVAFAWNIPVTSNADTNVPGTLRWAIFAASGDAGSTIDIQEGLDPIVLTSDLSMIITSMTINGNGVTISGNNQHRVFFVNCEWAGSPVNIQNLTIADGCAKGGNGGTAAGGGMGAGGAIFVNKGAVQISGVSFTGNAAQGGNGGNGAPTAFDESPASGGGGGLGGAGGTGTVSAGGGGGGYQGDGGSAAAGNFPSGAGGGGGGGFYGNGGNSSGSNGGAGGGYTHAQGTTPGTFGGTAGTNALRYGGAGLSYGGGGGAAGYVWSIPHANGGAGAYGGGGGGASIGGTTDAFGKGGQGGDGGEFGGGGGSPGGGVLRAGNGGFGGGGGGGGGGFTEYPSPSYFGTRGGLGGFGGGGGGSTQDTDGAENPVTFGGRGGRYDSMYFPGTAGGGGGAGLGGAIFVRSGNGASLEFLDGTESSSGVTGGLAGTSPLFLFSHTELVAPEDGQAIGSAIFLPTGNSDFSSGAFGGEIAGDVGAVLHKVGEGTLTILGSLRADSLITAGTISIGNGGSAGSLGGKVANNSSLIFNCSNHGVVFDGSLSGSGTVKKTGAGTVIFAGDNSLYTGSLNIDEGVLALDGGGNPSNRVLDTTINAGGSLRLLEQNQIGTSTITVNGGTFDFNDKVDYFASLVMKNGGTVNGGGAFTLESVDSPLLSATGGGNAGTIATDLGITSEYGVGGDADRTVQIDAADATSLTISGAIRDTLEGAPHVGSLNKTGTGTLVLSGENTYTGTTSVNGGTLRFASPSAFYGGFIDSDAAGKLAVASGATAVFNVGDTSDFSTHHIDTLRASGSFAPGSYLGFDTSNGGAYPFTYTSYIEGSVGITKLGAGTLGLTNFNAFTGPVTINGGTLSLESPGAIGTSSTIIFGGGTLKYAAAIATDYSSRFSTDAGQQYRIDTNGQFVTLASALTSIGGSLEKLGAGSLILTGSNSFTGPITLRGGRLLLGSAGAIGTSSTISFGGGTLQYTAANTTDYSSRFSTAAGQQYRIDTDGQSVTLASALTSSGGSFLKLGTGTVTLPAASTYTGVTTVNAGTLAVGSTSLSSSFVIASGAVLELNSTSVDRDMLGASTFSGTGTLRKTGAGGVYWGASAATFAMGGGSLIDVQAGAIYAGSYANEVWTGNLADLNVASGARFQGGESNVRVDALGGSGRIGTGSDHPSYQSFSFGADNGSGSFAGVLADDPSHAGNFTKLGTGTQILSGANTYTGTTVISKGTLAFTGSMSGTGALTVASGGSLAGTSTLPMPVTVQSGGAIAPGSNGAGTLTLSGAVSLNGGCKLHFELGTLSDKLALTGSYTPPDGGTVVVNVAGLAGFGGGSYPLITGAAGISAGSFSLNLGTAPTGYSYSLTAAGGTLSLNVLPFFGPSGLAAVAGTGQVSLTWSPAANATGYNVKRSTQAGGPYTVNAANVPGTGLVDTGLTNGTPYYYVVSALYSGAESPDSAEVSAMPLAPLGPMDLLAPTLVRDGNLMHLSIASSSLGRSYQLQRSLTLEGNSWEDIGEAIPGTGAGLTFDDSPPAEAEQCFFRIVILP